MASSTLNDSFNLTSASAIFKRKYDTNSVQVVKAVNPLQSQLGMKFGFTGEIDGYRQYVQLSAGGGIGFGSGANSALPTATQPSRVQKALSRKKIYYRSRIDGEAIDASTDEGAFVAGLAEEAARGPKGFSRLIETSLFAVKATDGSSNVVSGAWGTVGSVTGTDPYVVTLGLSGDARKFQTGDIVNVETGNSDKFIVTDVAVKAGTITISRQTGSQIPVATDEIFIENGEDNGVISIDGVTGLASGESLYGISYRQNYEPGAYIDASSTGLNVEKLDEACLDIEDLTQEGVDTIITSFDQWRKLSASSQDMQRINVGPKGLDAVAANLGFSSLKYHGPKGDAVIMRSKYCADAKCYLINSRRASMRYAKKPQWKTLDGSVFLREANIDSYEARYGAYGELDTIPTFHGQIYDLA